MKKNNPHPPGAEHELIDLELNCFVCHGRLYAPLADARNVVATVNSGGTALLLCPYCGQGNVIRLRRPPDSVPSP
ncbi:hypothetical protein KDA_75600 [Dictyobacter alpinus]|uniref:Uncharacterized protein n=1 Tax=Dictyobacter alpinus TaxID=2014873 RepID=A0A402BL74_9CHLR|nr:hypothetical protein [Dictyobacter alpinus]GCE32076.1 hypothetical protein KDA_75600 [Dictyobacter alpinus]